MNELLTTGEMTRADALAIAAGVPSLALMEAAGAQVAQAAASMLPEGDPILIVCGPGNNGGDGFVAARHLQQDGRSVRVVLLGARDALQGDAAVMADRYQGSVEQVATASCEGAGLIVDALFGAGLSRPLSGDAARLVEAINASGAPVLAVDVPSGLDGTTGQATGPCIKARRTVTFFRKKPAHVLMPGRAVCGDVIVADIGIPETVLADIAPKTSQNGPGLWGSRYPWPCSDGHKYDRGHAVIVSGPAEQSGAARLSARGALRVGAGLVTLIGSSTATAINAAHTSAIMVRAVAGGAALSEFLTDPRRNAVLIGPGASVGPATAADTLRILKTQAAVVLDADALTSFAGSASTPEARSGRIGFLGGGAGDEATRDTLFSSIKSRSAGVVITPHDGEFKKLFGDLPGSKLDRARSAARVSGAIVILKGADTVIASPDGRAAVNTNAPPWLATAGSGDVLAGFVAGLLAQQMPAFEAACAAVWLHSESALRFGIGLIAEDLPERLPEVLRSLYAVAGPATGR